MSGLLAETLALGALAGLLALDSVALMISTFSRPLVAGPLAGALLGDWQAGLAAGALLELLSLSTLPVGSLVPPDVTLAAVFAAAMAVWGVRWGLAPEAAGSLGVLFSGPVALLGARAEIWQRHRMDQVSRELIVALDRGEERALDRGVFKGLSLVILRGTGIAWLLLLPLALLGPGLVGLLSPALREGLAWCWWVLFAGGLACMVDFFWERRHLRWLLAGAVITVLAAYILRLSPTGWLICLGCGSLFVLVWEQRASGLAEGRA